MELYRASREVKQGVCVLTPLDLHVKKTERNRISSWIIALLRARRIRRVMVPPSFPIGIALRLRRARIQLVVAKGAIFPEREIKSTREIACIRETQEAAAIAMRFAIRKISKARVDRAGFLVERGHQLTAEEMRRAIDLKLTELQRGARHHRCLRAVFR